MFMMRKGCEEGSGMASGEKEGRGTPGCREGCLAGHKEDALVAATYEYTLAREDAARAELRQPLGCGRRS